MLLRFDPHHADSIAGLSVSAADAAASTSITNFILKHDRSLVWNWETFYAQLRLGRADVIAGITTPSFQVGFMNNGPNQQHIAKLASKSRAS